MSKEYYHKLLCDYAIKSYLIASDIELPNDHRIYAIKFLYRLNKQLILIKLDNHSVHIYYCIYQVICLIKKSFGISAAFKELIRFYPELKTPWIYDALESGAFDLTNDSKLL